MCQDSIAGIVIFLITVLVMVISVAVVFDGTVDGLVA